VDELLALEVDSAAPPPSDDAIVEFYASNKASLQGTLADHVVSIRAYLRNQRRESVLDFVKKLKKDYGAASYLEPQRIAISTEGRPSKGRADAPVTIVEFSDFECPYCAGLFPTLQQIMADYKDKARLVYLQFPLADIHQNALKAAEASLCALDQNKFWQMHDAMFADPSNLKVKDLKRKSIRAFAGCEDVRCVPRQRRKVRRRSGRCKSGFDGRRHGYPCFAYQLTAPRRKSAFQRDSKNRRRRIATR
jgi:protein-disulfide isomerase